MEYQIIVWSGHRPPKLGGYNEKAPQVVALKKGLRNLVLDLCRNKSTRHITGGALGIDQWVAEIVLDLKKQGWDMSLHIEMPFPGFEEAWPLHSQERLYNLVDGANSYGYTAEEYMPNIYNIRNDEMLRHIHKPGTGDGTYGMLIAIWDGSTGGTAHAIKAAQRRKLETFIYSPDDLRERVGYEHIPF